MNLHGVGYTPAAGSGGRIPLDIATPVSGSTSPLQQKARLALQLSARGFTPEQIISLVRAPFQ